MGRRESRQGISRFCPARAQRPSPLCNFSAGCAITQTMTPVHVLYVADGAADARSRGLVAELPSSAFRLEIADTLAAALPRASSCDCLLLELAPSLVVEDVLARLLAVAPATPIIALGAEDDAQAAAAMRAGAQEYLPASELGVPLLARSIRYAIERRRLTFSEAERARSERAADRALFVTAALGEVTASLDPHTALSGLAQMLVPRIADVAIVDLVQDDGRITRVAQAGYVGELPDVERTGSGAVHDPVLSALERRSSVLLTELDIARADERHRVLLERVQASAILVTPLLARGEAIGAISLVSSPSRGGLDSSAQRLAEEVASHAGLAIDNMRLFERAQRAVRGRDELLAIVSHDLRNPINVISLAIGTLEQPDGAQRLPQSLPRMRRALKRMEHLIDDLLDVARVDAGTLQVEPVVRSIAAVLDETHEQWRPLCAEKNIRLAKEYPDGLGEALIDRHRVMQVLSNLIGNSIKFTPAGGTLKIGAGTLGPWIKVSVSDTGPGIAPENLPHVFDRFWQKERRTDGLGLGLAIAKGIVAAHGGSIQVESTLGQGTTFSFTVPRAPD